MKTEAIEYMSLLQEIQNSYTSTFTILPLNEPRFIIDADTRKINIPIEFSFIGVQHDHKAETIWFEIDRYFDDEDLSNHTCVVQFVNKSTSETKEGTYPVTKMDLNSAEGKIIFGWEIENDVTQLVGDITFSVRFYSISEEGYFTYNFNTLPSTSSILETLNVIHDGEDITPSDYEKCVSKVDSLKKELQQLEQKIKEIDGYVNGLQQGEVMLVQPMLTAKIYDDGTGK